VNLFTQPCVLSSANEQELDLSQDKQILESALLVVRWQRGDHSAFEGIVKLWEQSLFYYLRRLTSSETDAWELLQETWLKTLRSLKSVRDPRALPAFLYRTARNAAISRLRRPEFFQLDSQTDAVSDDRQTNPALDFDNAEQIHQALEQLPLLQREAITLFFLQELSLEEMAVLLGVPLGTVKSRLHYAKQAIREILLKGDSHAAANYAISPATAERSRDVSVSSRRLSEGA
jgi:RNA polymerase sigma-70 factor (ECF subfamily)